MGFNGFQAVALNSRRNGSLGAFGALQAPAIRNPSVMAEQPHDIWIPRAEVEAFCLRNHVRRLALFGSILTDRFRADSDVDVLVEFERGRVPGLLGLAEMELELAAMVGRKVDLRTPQELSRYFRDDVVRTALVQYERP